MKITRELVSEAIALGKDSLPKFTAIELAMILGVTLMSALRVIQANRKNFRFDAEKNILGLDATSSVKTVNSTEVWEWYLKNRLAGDSKKCLPVSDQGTLGAAANSRVKWENNFSFAAATFLSQEISGSDVSNRATTQYGPEIASRMVRLGTVGGMGQVTDRYLFGVIVTEAEINARRLCGLFLYSAQWAMEEMLTEIDWTVVESDPAIKSGVQWVSPDEMNRSLPAGGDANTKAESDKSILDSARAAADRKKQEETTTKKGRRTNEELAVARKEMVDDLISKGVSAGLANRVQIAEKFVDAEKLYKEILVDLEKNVPGQQTLEAAGVQVGADPDKRATLSVDGKVVVAAAPGHDLVIAAVPQGTDTPPTSGRSTMATLATLEGVSDLKADIRAKAGADAPPPVPSTAVPPPLAAAVANLPTSPTQPAAVNPLASAPPVAAAVPAGGSASAEDLLDGLLKSTGQG